MTETTDPFDVTGRHPGVIAALAMFNYDHLPPHLARISAQFADLAEWLVIQLPDDPLLTVCLSENLWDAKNRAVALAAKHAQRQDAQQQDAPTDG